VTVAVSRAIGGNGSVVWVEGPKGIGKSTLVRELMDDPRTAAFRVLPVKAVDPGRPYGVVNDLLDSLVDADRDAVRLITDRVAVGDEGGTMAHLGALVVTSALEHPLLIVGEDLHAADDASLLAWHGLARLAPSVPMLLLATCRPAPTRPRLSQLRERIRRRGGTVISLPALTDIDAGRLAEELLGAPADRRLAGRIVAMGGNPKRLGDFLADLRTEGCLAWRKGRVDVVDEPRADDVLVGHLTRPLSNHDRDVLQSASLLGETFNPTSLALATGQPLPDIAASLADAVELGLLKAGGDRLAFAHGVAHAAVVHTMPPDQQHAFHAETARRFALAGTPAPVVAHHLLAGDAMPEWAMDWLTSLPEPSLLGAAGDLVTLLRWAIRDLSEADGRRPVLATRLATVTYWTGQDARAAAQQALTATRADPTLGPVALDLAIRVLAERGLLLSVGPLLASAQARRRGFGPARRAAWLALVHADRGDFPAAVTDAQRAWRLAESPGTPAGVVGLAAHALVRVGLGSTMLDRLPNLLATLTDELESREARAQLIGDLMELLLQAGEGARLRAAMDDAEELVDRADAVSRPAALRLRATLARASYHRGENDRAAAELARVGGRDSRPSFRTEARAMISEQLSQVGRALALRQRLYERNARQRPTRLEGVEQAVRLALETGDRSRAEWFAQRCEEVGAREDLALQTAVARCVRAMIADEAPTLLDVAADFARLGAPRQQASALEEAAVRLAVTVGRDAARAAMRTAREIYAELDSRWDLDRVQRRLRPLGLRLPRAAAGPAGGGESLSLAEERIARLIVIGMSNPEIAVTLFLTRNTVQTHVSKILSKLGVKSRHDVAQALLGVPTGPESASPETSTSAGPEI
jgi:DNA-binding CsgD family transcriptional regulator